MSGSRFSSSGQSNNSYSLKQTAPGENKIRNTNNLLRSVINKSAKLKSCGFTAAAQTITKGFETKRAFASTRSCKIWLIAIVVIVTGENKVKSYFVVFAQNHTM